MHLTVMLASRLLDKMKAEYLWYVLICIPYAWTFNTNIVPLLLSMDVRELLQVEGVKKLTIILTVQNRECHLWSIMQILVWLCPSHTCKWKQTV